MDWKSCGVNLLFAIVGLVLTMGLVGLAVYSSYWYSLVTHPLWKELVGNTWKNIGVCSTTFLTLSIVVGVLSFSFDYTIHFLIASGILQIPSFGLVITILVLSSNKNKEKYYQQIANDTSAFSNWVVFTSNNNCKFLHSEDPTCTNVSSNNMCCDHRLLYYVENRTTSSHQWFLAFFLMWIICIILMGILSFLFCERSSKN